MILNKALIALALGRTKMTSANPMTAPDSRYLDEAMARLAEAVAQPVGGSIVISAADACAIGNELRRLQALARGPHAPTPIPGEYADERMEQPPTFSARYFKRRAEAAEAALREAGRDAEDAKRWRSFRKTRSIRAEGLTPEHWDAREDAQIAAAEADAYDAALNGGQDDNA